jgi:hypothetical protein
MKNLLTFVSLFLISFNSLYAFDVKQLYNNKELSSNELTSQDSLRLRHWIKNHDLDPEEIRLRALNAMTRTFEQLDEQDVLCELGISSTLLKEVESSGLIKQRIEYYDFLVYLRNNNMIDDILFRILVDSKEINTRFEEIDKASTNTYYPRAVKPSSYDLEKLYSDFSKWPDEISNCSINSLSSLVSNLNYVSKKNRDKLISSLNYSAYRQGLIDQKTYQKLVVLGQYQVLDWKVHFDGYFQIIKNAKDKLTKNPETRPVSDFSDTYISRRNNLTRRTRLFMNYDSTQIIMLTKVIERTAKRMDAKNVHLYFQYGESPSSDDEIYIFSPMEQYRVALRLLRKDMAELRRSETFQNSGVTYEDIIAAAFETGYLKSSELDHILKFDDLWNPKISRWKSLSNFTLNIAGSAAFFLPTPWNYISAIGLIFTQSKVAGANRVPDPLENENVIF